MHGRFFHSPRQPTPALSQAVTVTVDLDALRLLGALQRIPGDPLAQSDNFFHRGLTALAEHELARRCYVLGDGHESSAALAVLLEAHSHYTYLCQEGQAFRLDRNTLVWVPLWTPDIQYAEEVRQQRQQDADEALRLLDWEFKVERVLTRKYGNAHHSKAARAEKAKLLAAGPPADWPRSRSGSAEG